jgi:hypothetical protein
LQFVFELELHCGKKLPLQLFRLDLSASDFARALDRCLETPSADERSTVFLMPGIFGHDPALASFSAQCSHASRIVGVIGQDLSTGDPSAAAA